MSKTLAVPINIFSDGCAPPAVKPEALPHCGRAFGLLMDILLAEDCKIARILNKTGERLIVLPPDQDLDLSSHIGERIGLVQIDSKLHYRRLGQ